MEINVRCLWFCNSCKHWWFKRKLNNSTHMKTGTSNNSHNFLSPFFSSSLCPPVSYTSFVYGKAAACEAAVGSIKAIRTTLGWSCLTPLCRGAPPTLCWHRQHPHSSTQRAQLQRQAVVAASSAWTPVTRWVHSDQSAQQGRACL